MSKLNLICSSGDEDVPSQLETSAHVHWQRFTVTFDFPVCFTKNLFRPENPLLIEVLNRYEADSQQDRRHRCLFFIDSGLANANPTLIEQMKAYAAHHAAAIELVCDPVPVPGGEQVKALPTYVEEMKQMLAAHHIDRHSYCIAIGGGAVLDAVGFAAATAHRGVRHIRIPSTVLAQNDAGVGVKNGINQFGQKNFTGTFAPPFAVLNDLNLVWSLPDRDKIAGMAEAVKVALIRDRAFFLWLEEHADRLAAFRQDAMAHMIQRCAELHMHQIAHGGDPFETGSARPLDYGHWSAHKLENMTSYHLRHGEAVAIGIALDARYSVLAGLLDAGLDERICQLLETLGFQLWHSSAGKRDENGQLVLLNGLQDFQEHLGGQLTITLLRDLGVGIECHSIDNDLVACAIEWLMKRSGPHNSDTP